MKVKDDKMKKKKGDEVKEGNVLVPIIFHKNANQTFTFVIRVQSQCRAKKNF